MEIKDLIPEIEGWLAVEEGQLLYDLALKCTGKGVIVEIGSWKGRSTVCLAWGSKSGCKAKVYAIDPHTGSSDHKQFLDAIWTYEEFCTNIQKAKVNEIVIPIVKTSEEAAETFVEPVELIFIDGEHDYKSVERDFQLWFPKVISGGIMAFHDATNWQGPLEIVKKYIYDSNNFKNIGKIETIVYATKN